MQDLPHRYCVEASASSEGPIELSSMGLEALRSDAPLEFGGPGNLWSPETLLVAATVDCLVLTFRAIARGSGLQWLGLRCSAQGTLDRVDRVTRFTGIEIHADLVVGPDVDEKKAARLLEKAERSCLVSSSLALPVTLDTRVSRSPSPGPVESTSGSGGAPFPSEIRRRVLDQHADLRTMLDGLESAAHEVLGGNEARREELRDGLRHLVGMLGAHMDLEDSVLPDTLRVADPWGPIRAERFSADHVRQRALLVDLDARSEQAGSGDLGLLALGFVALLRADMDYEERTFLDPDLIRDDPIITAPEPE